jgi:hypothetical protein
MFTLWEAPSLEALEGGQLIPGDRRIRDVVHGARVAGFNSPGRDEGCGRGGHERRTSHGISTLKV